MKIIQKILNMFDTMPIIMGKKVRDILKDKDKTKDLFIAINNEQHNNNNPTTIKVTRIGI
jgi:hypothetical protein